MQNPCATVLDIIPVKHVSILLPPLLQCTSLNHIRGRYWSQCIEGIPLPAPVVMVPFKKNFKFSENFSFPTSVSCKVPLFLNLRLMG